MDHSTAGFTTSNLTLPHSEQLDKALASMLPIEGPTVYGTGLQFQKNRKVHHSRAPNRSPQYHIITIHWLVATVVSNFCVGHMVAVGHIHTNNGL